MAGAGAQVFDYFRQRISPAAAAGIVGNTQQESSNDPNAPGGGLIQGQGGRTSSGTLQQQLEGVWRELNGPERGTLQALRGAKDPRTAARIFSERFERPGIPMLSNRERYAVEALQHYLGRPVTALGGSQGTPGTPGTPGAPARPGAGPGGGVARSPAQVEDLMALVDALQPSGPSTSVEGLSVPKPGTAGPHVPQELPQEPAVAPSSLLGLISKIGEDAPEGEAPSAVGVPARKGTPGVPGEAPVGPHAGYVNPLPGFVKGRTDQGVDYSAQPGAPIRAIGNGKVLGISPDWYKGQPYLYYELTDGPQRGKVMFVAEQITPRVKPGDSVRAGQTIGVYAPSGTGIETGYSTRSGATLARATSGYTEGQETPAGKQVRRLLEALGAR